MPIDQAQNRGVWVRESDFLWTETGSKVYDNRTQHLPDLRKETKGGAQPESLEAPLHDVVSTMQGLANRSNRSTDGWLFIILPAGKASRYVP
jgi:hypothetical protein